MKRYICFLSSLFLIMIMLGLAGCTINVPTQTGATGGTQTSYNGFVSNGIMVTGIGKVSVEPEMAVLVVGVEVQKKTVAEAQAIASESMASVMEAITSNGIDEKDIRTTRFGISQKRDYSIITGYTVTNKVQVAIRDIENVSSIVDAIVKAGGDYIRMSSFRFVIEEDTDYFNQAIENATADAKAKAQKLAEENGVSLGNPISISVTNELPYSYYLGNYLSSFSASYEIGAIQPSFSPGELDVYAVVNIIYSIE